MQKWFGVNREGIALASALHSEFVMVLLELGMMLCVGRGGVLGGGGAAGGGTCDKELISPPFLCVWFIVALCHPLTHAHPAGRQRSPKPTSGP